MFLLWLGWRCMFWEEDQRIEVWFSSHHISGANGQQDITVDVDLDHLTEVWSVRFLHRQVIYLFKEWLHLLFKYSFKKFLRMPHLTMVAGCCLFFFFSLFTSVCAGSSLLLRLSLAAERRSYSRVVVWWLLIAVALLSRNTGSRVWGLQ